MTPQDWLWEHGWRILMETGGYSERKARTLVGKWIKENGADVVERGLQRMTEVKPVDPISWLQAGFAKIHERDAWKRTSGKVENGAVGKIEREHAKFEARPQAEKDRVAKGLHDFAKRLAAMPSRFASKKPLKSTPRYVTMTPERRRELLKLPPEIMDAID